MEWQVRGERGGTSRLGATVVGCAWWQWGGDGPRTIHRRLRRGSKCASVRLRHHRAGFRAGHLGHDRRRPDSGVCSAWGATLSAHAPDPGSVVVRE